MLTSRLMGWMLNRCSRTGWTSVCTDWSTWVERSEVSALMRVMTASSLTGRGAERAPALAAWGLIRGSDGSGSLPWHHQGCRCGTRF